MSQEAIRQTQAEFTAFLSALDTVESAGHGGLVALPRERLIEIQRILRAGGGVLQPLPPLPAPGSTSTTTSSLLAACLGAGNALASPVVAVPLLVLPTVLLVPVNSTVPLLLSAQLL